MPDSIRFLGYQKTADSELFSLNQFSKLIEQYTEMGYQPAQELIYLSDKPPNLIDVNTAKQNFISQLKNSQLIVSHDFWQAEFDFNVSFDNDSQAMWSLSASYGTLGIYSSISTKELCSQMFLNAIRVAIEVYQPYYGCIFNEIREIPSPSLDELSKVSEIYEVNFFSFELIEHRFNEQLLLSTPAWKTEKLSCGFLVVPSLRAVYSPGSDENTLSLVASHIGLDS